MRPEIPVAVVDYGMGNLASVARALTHAGAAPLVTNDPASIHAAERVVLPGVGAFSDCMKRLDDLDLLRPLAEAAETKPFLGICLGLQVLFDHSEEFGPCPGLGILGGEVVKFKFEPTPGAHPLKVPHIGWNRVEFAFSDPLWSGIESGSYFYFVHSYHCVPDEPGLHVAHTDYGTDFVSCVVRDNLVACQFHPEKSHAAGLRFLANWLARG